MKKITIVIFWLFATAFLQAQNYYIDFMANGVTNILDSVFVQNLTQETSLTLGGGDTLVLMGTVDITDKTPNSSNIRIYPNPFNEKSYMEFYNETQTMIAVDIYDVVGKNVLSLRQELERGMHFFEMTGFATGHYQLIVKADTWQKAAAFVSLQTNNQNPQLQFKSTLSKEPQTNTTTRKSSKNTVQMFYTTGDQMRYRGFSSHYAKMELDTPTSSKTITFLYNYSNIKAYYASPNGTGNGTYASPFKIYDFWAVAQPGDTLNLFDGHYIGPNSMINPPSGFSGTAINRVVIRALNDGMVDIDGQESNPPVKLSYNDYFTLEGVNAHHAGSTSSFNVSVVSLNYSSYNILRRICAWEATDGNTNIFGVHNGNYNLLEDCAGWGTARKTFSNAQYGNYTTFRRCFGRWEGSHAQGPKKTFGFSYNSYNALLENCIATWDGLKMQQNYELHDYNGNGVGQFYSNYEVQQPDGMFSHDGFDVMPDVANAKLYGCIAYLKANQRYHNSFKKWAAPFAVEIKGVEIIDALSYIQPGSHTDIWNVNLASVGNTTTNRVDTLIQIGGDLGHIHSNWSPQNVVSSVTCGNLHTGAIITKRYINGVKTNQNLWPWPMNQRIIDAMKQGGYTPINITSEIFGLCP